MTGLDEFMKEGFRHYGTATAATRRFEAEIKRQYLEAIAVGTRVGGVEVSADPKANPNQFDGWGAWIALYVPIRVAGQEDQLDVGLWWDPPKHDGKLVVYGKPLWPKKSDLEFLMSRPAKGRVSPRYLGPKAHLVADFDPELAIEVQLREVFEAVAEAVEFSYAGPK